MLTIHPVQAQLIRATVLHQSAPAVLAVKRSQWLQQALWASRIYYMSILLT